MPEFDTITQTASNSGVPTTLPDELKAENDTEFDTGGPSYDTLGNDVNLPDDMYDRLQDGTLRDTDLPTIYNELWHAFWDQILEERGACAWLYAIAQAEARDRYDGNLDMVEEAMSETVDTVVWSLLTGSRRGRTPDLSYDGNAQPPAHNDRGEKWEGEPLANQKISEELYDVTLYVLFFDCEPPEGYDPSTGSAEEHLERIRTRVRNEVPGRAGH
ncbi:MAG: hypothetical protein ACE5PT_04950 [Gemmatimonadales bacterium]